MRSVKEKFGSGSADDDAGRKEAAATVATTAGVVLIALAVRVTALQGACFWTDEVVTSDRVDLSLESMLSLGTLNVQAPLYYLLLRAWAELFGSTDAALRSFSAVVGVAAVGLVIVAARRWFGAGAGIVTGLILALHPVAVYFSREARGYSLMIAIEAATFALLASIMTERARRPTYVALAGLQVAGVAVHYSLAVVVLLQGLVVVAICLGKRDLRGLAAYATVPLVCLLVAAPALSSQAGMLDSQWGQRGFPGTRAAMEIVEHLLGDGAAFVAPFTMIVLVAFALGWLRKRDPGQPGRGMSSTLLLLAAAATPILVCVLLPLVLDVPLKLRYAVSAIPPLVILGGAGFAQAWTRGRGGRVIGVVAVIAVTLGMVQGIPVLYSPRLHQDWRPVAGYLTDVFLDQQTEMLIRLKDQGRTLRRYHAGRFEWQGMNDFGFFRAIPVPVDLDRVRSRAAAGGKTRVLLLYEPRFAGEIDASSVDRAGAPLGHTATVELASSLRLVVLSSTPVDLPDPRTYGSMEKPRPHPCVR